MQASIPLTREIVLIGGGHAHALLLRDWGMKPLPGARLTLINPAATAPYTGMLPGFIAGHYSRETLEIDLVKLARFAGARMIIGKVTGINRDARQLTIPGRPPVAYDIASIDVGITSNMPDLPGFSEHGIAAKPLGPFATRWQAHLDGKAGPAVVIGGGVAGVELALAMQYALGGRGKVTVIEAKTALQGIGDSTRQSLLDAMRGAGIDLIENTTATEVSKSNVTLSDGRKIDAIITVGAAGARPFAWLEETGLQLENGYIAVDDNLRALNDPNIFAVGDCAHLQTPRPKAGVFAVRAAPVLTRNLKAAAAETPLKPFKPQSHYLKLISLGGKSALADKWHRSIGGKWAWTWKDRIDRAFMDRLAHLPSMKHPKLPSLAAAGIEEARGPKPLCGGCGAKISADVLGNVLSNLTPHSRDDVLTGAGDDAAVLNVNGTKLAFTTDHLRAFWADPWLFGRITALHAMGDVWAMGAAPQAALAHITLPQMARHMQKDWLREIMAAASETFAAEGAAIVGGHSTLGAELVVGFSVTGIAEAPPLTIDGAQEGDALLLTRPIGSGTILAAEMQGKADGDDVIAALDIMAQTQGDAAKLLAPIAHAMTDVTGFGLGGHAARMAQASNLSAAFNLETIPLYQGSEDLVANGIRSSIWQANRDAVTAETPDTPRATLLFDPQTAGGLLTALPADKAQTTRDALQKMGHKAEIIGEMNAASGVTLTAR
ncbi:selenide, water dikinase SelD [bacterium]|nr:selenide, water dikinase SelD [bacterium]